MYLELTSCITCVLLNPTIDHVHEIEHFEVGGTFKIQATHVFPAGKAISVALGLRSLGEDPTVIALIGKEDIKTYRDFLGANSIPATLIPVNGATRHNMTIVDPVEGTVTHLRETGFTASESHVDAVKKRLKKVERDAENWVIFSGSTPPGLNENTYAGLVEYASNLGYKTLVDISGSPLVQTMARHKPWLLKINKVELDDLLGCRSSDAELDAGTSPVTRDELDVMVSDARGLLDDRLSMISVTLGAGGAILVTKDLAFHGMMQDMTGIKVINTVGAGDAFFAGLIHALLREKSPSEMLKEAISSATAKILVHGAGLFSPAEHDTFLARVLVQVL
ncbi:MAG TPA: PfkB family carbohydrate kinase [Candidatus Lokiarchaeia archaeon]|nr:PfkB family carbohydrate kinase [Candidatus Lokiarchaeia archaeon]